MRKKVTILSLLLIFTVFSSVHALSWAINFVVWKGKVYEVKQAEPIKNNRIGHVIGEVETKPDDMTGEYYGNASNFYPIGTKYYEIKGVSTSHVIAIKHDNQWIKAIYVHKAPFHIMNLLTNPMFIFSIPLLALILIGFIFRVKKLRIHT
ncbi:hypothetical protein [Priestia koreensis]|uniref:hypothetical protein n=1 Tax=Priestia koreensis TaxID=284581 RepID=UPI0028F6E6BC|nr:hypothetical protein [Priestia koreensis]